MILAVTGATGFLGRAFVAAAVDAGHEVRALVRREADAPSGTKVFTGALPDSLPDAFLAGAEVLVHLAALGVQSRDRDWTRACEVNVTGSVALVRMAAAAGVKHVVLAGTCLEYEGFGTLPDRPAVDAVRCDETSSTETADAYGATKAAGGLAARAAARQSALPWWYLRFASLYGEGDDAAKLLPGGLAAAREGRVFETSPGAQEREWLHVDDAVAALLLAATKKPPTHGALVNIGTGEGVTLAALVTRVFELAGASAELVRLGARGYRPGEVHRLVMAPGRARELLGWTPRVSLEEGLKRLVEGPSR